MRPNPKKTSIKKAKREQALAKAADKGLSYEERLAPAKRKAIAEGIGEFVDIIKAARQDTINAADLQIRAVNKLAEAGAIWKAISDRNQFDMPFYDSVQAMIPANDRELITPNAIKVAVSLANDLDGKKVKTLAEAESYMQKFLFEFGVMEKPQRQLAQGGEQNDWGTQLPVEIGKLTTWLKQLVEVEPVDNWPKERLETFLTQTDFIEQQRAAAKAKLEGN